ncbi:MAG: acyltransferase [Pseudomonadota bacterium]
MSPRSDSRIHSLDGLRFVAAMAVLLYHFSYRGQMGDPYTAFSVPILQPVTQFFHLGVGLFFVISGFVICWSVLQQNTWDFLRRRFLRLYPAFVIAVFATSACALLIGGGLFHATPQNILANLTFLPQLFGQTFTDGVYWSIVVELIFYGWVALLAYFGVLQRWFLPTVSAWLSIAILNEFVIQNEIIEHLFLTPHAGYFIAGMLLYRRMIARQGEPLDWIYLVLAIAHCVVFEMRRGIPFAENAETQLELLSVALATLCVFAMFALTLKITVPDNLIRYTTLLGAISYPLYLVHQNIGYMILNQVDGLLPEYGSLLVAISLTVGLAWLITRFAEPRMLGYFRHVLGMIEQVARHLRFFPDRRNRIFVSE